MNELMDTGATSSLGPLVGNDSGCNTRHRDAPGLAVELKSQPFGLGRT